MTAKPKGSIPGYLEGFSDGRVFQLKEIIKALKAIRNKLPSEPQVIETVDAIIKVMEKQLPEEDKPLSNIVTVEW